MMFCFCIKIVKADDDDDDDIFAELIGDIIIGVAIATCESNAVCNMVLTIGTLLFITIGLIGWCINGCQCECERPSNRSLRRAGGVSVGYGIGRSIMS